MGMDAYIKVDDEFVNVYECNGFFYKEYTRNDFKIFPSIKVKTDVERRYGFPPTLVIKIHDVERTWKSNNNCYRSFDFDDDCDFNYFCKNCRSICWNE